MAGSDITRLDNTIQLIRYEIYTKTTTADIYCIHLQLPHLKLFIHIYENFSCEKNVQAEYR